MDVEGFAYLFGDLVVYVLSVTSLKVWLMMTKEYNWDETKNH